MNLKQLLIIISIATAIFWLVWGMVLFQINPEETDFFGFLLFYLTLFFALLGSFFLGSFLWRKIFNKYSMEYQIVGTSFRQSFFFAIMITGILFLQSKSVLTWWNMLLLIIGLTILEFFFLSYKRKL